MISIDGQISMFEGKRPLKITKPIRLIELFAGIGAQAKALENIGVEFEHYRICEFDKYAVESYNAVHGTEFTTSDITRIHASDLGIVETDKYEYIMTYSFPCTDLSKAGKQQGMSRGSGTRSGLLWEVERLLKEAEELPQILLMENVPDVLSEKNREDFFEWYRFLESLGYTNKYAKLNAKYYGIPQNRERVFMVSFLGDYYYRFPKGKCLDIRLKDILEENIDQKYYLSDKLIHSFLHNEEKQQDKGNSFKFSLSNKESVSKAITTKEGWRMTDNFILDEQNRKIRIDGIVGTLTTDGSSPKHNNRVIEPDFRIRRLTPKECWRLMGFSDEDFEKAREINSDTQLYKQAGNSIVVPVLEAIFRQML